MATANTPSLRAQSRSRLCPAILLELTGIPWSFSLTLRRRARPPREAVYQPELFWPNHLRLQFYSSAAHLLTLTISIFPREKLCEESADREPCEEIPPAISQPCTEQHEMRFRKTFAGRRYRRNVSVRH